MTTTQTKTNEVQFNGLEVISEVLNTDSSNLVMAFKAMKTYSIYNTMYACMQMQARNLPITPIKTFNGWKAEGYNIKKGSKAIGILFPMFVNIVEKDANGNVKKDANGKPIKRQFLKGFQEKHMHFCMADTTCTDYTADDFTIENYDLDKALAKCGITLKQFQSFNGNVMGYAKHKDNSIALNPMIKDKAELLHTLFHEVAHVVLGHTSKDCKVEKGMREYEADMTGYIVMKFLGLSNDNLQKQCKQYISSYLCNDFKEATSDKEVRKILKAVDTIVKAGM
jgi:Ca2+-binding EF-hand superfamily protein